MGRVIDITCKTRDFGLINVTCKACDLGFVDVTCKARDLEFVDVTCKACDLEFIDVTCKARDFGFVDISMTYPIDNYLKSMRRILFIDGLYRSKSWSFRLLVTSLSVFINIATFQPLSLSIDQTMRFELVNCGLSNVGLWESRQSMKCECSFLI